MNTATPYSPDILRKAQCMMLEILITVDGICRSNDIPYWLDGGTALGAVRHGGFIPWDDDLDICMLRKDYRRFLAVAETGLPENLFLQVFGKDRDYCLHWAKIRDINSTMEEVAYRRARFHKGIGIDIFPCDFFPSGKIMTGCEKSLAKAFRYRMKNLHPGMGLREMINCAASRCLCTMIPLSWETRLFDVFKHIFRHSRSRIGYGIGTPFSGRFTTETIFPLCNMMFEDRLFPVPNLVDQYLTVLYGNYKKLPPPSNRKPHAVRIDFGTPVI